MTLQNIYTIFTKSQREDFTLMDKDGMPYDFLCIWSSKKRKILYYGQLSDRRAGLSSNYTVNIEVVDPENFDKYKIRERETIMRLFSWEGRT